MMNSLRGRMRLGAPIFLAALNMRVALVVINPLIPYLKDEFALSTLSISILAGLPLVCFAVTGPVMAYVARLGSTNRIIALALFSIGLASLGRAFTGVIGLFIFTFIIGTAIAVMNFVVPSWVKENMAQHAAFVTGVYVTLMGLVIAIGLAIAVPLADATKLSWRLSTLPWALLSLAIALMWIKHARASRDRTLVDPIHFWRSSIFWSANMWALVFYFGIQSTIFYGTITWLPTILSAKGIPLASAAIAVSISGLIGSLFGLALPALIRNRVDLRNLLTFVAIITAIPYLALALVHGNALLAWMCVSSIGSALSFPLSLYFVVLKASDHEKTREISTMMQSAGYLIAAGGPALLGLLHDWSGGWNAALYAVCVMCAIQLLVGLKVGKPKLIS